MLLSGCVWRVSFAVVFCFFVELYGEIGGDKMTIFDQSFLDTVSINPEFPTSHEKHMKFSNELLKSEVKDDLVGVC